MSFGVTIEKWLRSPLSFVSATVTALLSMWGLWDIYSALEKKYCWIIASSVTFLPVLLVASCVAGLLIWNRRHGFTVSVSPRFLFSHVSQHWHIERDGTRRVMCRKTYVFFEEPTERDLSETLFGSLDLEYTRINYDTPDARIKDIEKLTDTVYRIYWEPVKEDIRLGQPYVHEFTYTYPPGTGAENKSITVAASVRSAVVDVAVTTETPIKWATAYKGKPWHRLRNFGAIKARAIKTIRTGCAPVKFIGPQKISWIQPNILPGETYFVVWETNP